VHGGAVVPDDEIVRLPLVAVDESRLGGVLDRRDELPFYCVAQTASGARAETTNRAVAK